MHNYLKKNNWYPCSMQHQNDFNCLKQILISHSRTMSGYPIFICLKTVKRTYHLCICAI